MEKNLDEAIRLYKLSAENCKNLTQVTFPKELNSIGNKAFKRCDLKEIVLPKVSSIDFAAFSYNSDALLDMRMDQTQKLSAYEVVNNYSKEELIKVKAFS